MNSPNGRLPGGATPPVVGARPRRWLARARIAAFAGAMLAGACVQAQVVPARIALLVPDGTSFAPNPSAPVAFAWMDAIREQGIEFNVLTATQFLANPSSNALLYRGVILPDSIHVQMQDDLVAAVYQYVSLGGRLMLTYDAGVLYAAPGCPGGLCYAPTSRFGQLAGVDYVLAQQLYPNLVGLGPVLGAASTFRQMGVPPGKSMPYTPALIAQSPQSCAAAGSAQTIQTSTLDAGGMQDHNHHVYHQIRLRSTAGKPAFVGDGQLRKARRATIASAVAAPLVLTDLSGAAVSAYDAVAGYGYGALCYPSFVTGGAYDGSAILGSLAYGVQAGLRSHGAGRVLFVNLPLGYLKTRDDGMLLHGFLDYFARDVAQVPRLGSTPDGVPGIVFNWHLDSIEAQAPTRQLKDRGVWKQGPFSIHMTAGPDTVTFGDGLGWNLPKNKTAQGFLKEFVKLGHQVGSHGGWIHDYYGLGVNDFNQFTPGVGCDNIGFQQCLVLNANAVFNVIRVRSTEYSAPLGNNPIWALQWYRDNGIEGYYSLSHTGMAPTKTWRVNTSVNPAVTLYRGDLWAIPLTTYGVTATFDDWDESGVPKTEILAWFADLLKFVQDRDTVREIYAHPQGAVLWPDVLDDWLARAATEKGKGAFRWYTMTDMARFMARREAVQWSVALTATGATRVAASLGTSGANLAGITWGLPKASYQRPSVTSGSATVSERGTEWRVRVNAGTSVAFEAQPL